MEGNYAHDIITLPDEDKNNTISRLFYTEFLWILRVYTHEKWVITISIFPRLRGSILSEIIRQAYVRE